MNRDTVSQLILNTLQNFDFAEVPPEADGFTEDTVLFGREGLLDSIGLVSFILDVEEDIRAQSGISITLADERAMSQSKSPFRSVGRLADYAALLIAEQQK